MTARSIHVGPHPPGADSIDLGRHHPTSHGGLVIDAEIDQPLITAVTIRPGFVHRGAEKLFEVRDYRQIPHLADRHDWVGSLAGELSVVLAAEQLLGLAVPERATALRTLLAELTRIGHHLAFLSSLPSTSGPLTCPDVLDARTAVLDAVEVITGHRIHPMTITVGGVAHDITGEQHPYIDAALTSARRACDSARQSLALPHIADAVTGVGVFDLESVLGYGLSGPVARASGHSADLRHDAPYLAYGELALPVIVAQAGDAAARYQVLIDEIEVSIQAVSACLAMCGNAPGPISVKMPATIRIPEGQAYTTVESPSGRAGVLLVSRGGSSPWRLKIRSATLPTLAALESVLVGTRLAHLPAIIASCYVVVGDVDR